MFPQCQSPGAKRTGVVRRWVSFVRHSIMEPGNGGGMTRSRKVLIGLAVLLGVLVAARLAMPYVVKDYVNDKLAALDSYDGHVDDIDIHLWRGAYSVDGLE